MHYNMLRRSAGWSVLPKEQAKIGLAHSSFIISCQDDEKVVGMVRVISDGGYIAYIADVIVLPEYQGKGIGKQMMQKVMDYLYGQLKPGWKIMVVLVAVKGKEGFYKKFNFVERPNEIFGAGMSQWIECPIK